MRFGGGGERTQIAYAAMQVDAPLTARLIAELPDVIRVDAWDDGEAGVFGAVLRLLAREAETIEPGGEAVMTRLADVLVIQVLRHWLRSSTATGWLTALRDPQVGHAIGRMHARPDDEWTLVKLARVANMSRSALPSGSRRSSASRRCVTWPAAARPGPRAPRPHERPDRGDLDPRRLHLRGRVQPCVQAVPRRDPWAVRRAPPRRRRSYRCAHCRNPRQAGTASRQAASLRQAGTASRQAARGIAG